jgi:hypothetical protein
VPAPVRATGSVFPAMRAGRSRYGPKRARIRQGADLCCQVIERCPSGLEAARTTLPSEDSSTRDPNEPHVEILSTARGV